MEETSWEGFIIKNFNCDFVVLVTLNGGYPKSKESGDLGVRYPDFYVMPVEYVLGARDPRITGEEIVKSRLKKIQRFQNRQDLIEDFLGASSP